MSQGAADVILKHPVSNDPDREVHVTHDARERKAIRAALNHTYGMLADFDKVPTSGPLAAQAAWDEWNALFPASQTGNPHKEG